MQNEKAVIRVILTDHYKIFRHGVGNALGKYPDVQVLAEAVNGQDLLDKLQYLRPDIIITDIRMPVMDGLETIKQVKLLYPGIKIMVFTMYDDPKMLLHTLELGANTYLLKTAGVEDIYAAISGCYRQWLYITPVIKKAFLVKASVSVFNNTELKILQMLYKGKTIEETADAVGVSVKTIAAMLGRMNINTNTKGIAGLILYVAKYKLVKEEL